MRMYLVLICCLYLNFAFGQIFINEGCNKNGIINFDENNEPSDWIELYNGSSSQINLLDWKLSDQLNGINAWVFPEVELGPNEFLKINCSGKNRFGSPPFIPTKHQVNFTPAVGWNTHTFTQSFNWDGQSNIIINVCAYTNTYTENSIFYQQTTSFQSSLFTYEDGSQAACSNNLGQTKNQRPNLKLNGLIIGAGNILNGNTTYPAPYGNWYWGARHQFLVLASELQAAGLSAGPINSLAFEVASTIGEFYSYIDISLNHTDLTDLAPEFLPLNGQELHTNFKLNAQGETVYLFDSNNQLQDQLQIKSPRADISVGRFPNGASLISWMSPTLGSSNNVAQIYNDSLPRPQISIKSTLLNGPINVEITTTVPSNQGKLVFTTNGYDPTFNSIVYSGPINIAYNQVLRAKVFPVNSPTTLPSEQAVASYSFNVSHTTPILMVNTAPTNLYGNTGIFENWWTDWVKPAYGILIDTGEAHTIIHEGIAAIRMDGGAGGSRSQPQHSFRLSWADGTYGDQPIVEAILPDRPNRHLYSDFYLRNGSNQYLNLPYKDAFQVKMMSQGTDNYYSSYRPVSVYINGWYNGLYELREKFNQEYFQEHDDASKDSIEILSLSYWYNLVLRAVEGDVNNFWNSYNQFLGLNTNSTTYWQEADQYFDLKHYTDYIIGESWIGNVDWPQNNIKIYRSDASQMRWRFALIDLELSLQPNGWSHCQDNHIAYMKNINSIPYIMIWKKSMLNEMYRNYFINRFADQMNTSFRPENLINTEMEFYNSMLPEMPLEFARWGDPNNIAGQMAVFEAKHLEFQQELLCRSTYVFNHLRSEFNLVKKVEVTLTVEPENAGEIHLNTIQPSTYPWSGTYFDGVPISLQPIAKPGFEFSHWLPASNIVDSLMDSLEINVTQNSQTFTAVFKSVPIIADGPDIHFSVNPNPNNGFFDLISDNKTIAKECSFFVCDNQGRVVENGQVSQTNQTPIDLSINCAGIYFINIYQNSALIECLKILKY